MIEKMHDKVNSPVFKVIFALVSISFVLTGIGGSLIGADTSIAKVNGEKIEQQAFNLAKHNEQGRLNAELGAKFWESLDNPIYATQFNNSILNNLIDEEVLRQYAKTLNMDISPKQIASQIVKNPLFIENGKYNNNLYLNLLRQNSISPDQYAAITREGMLMSQLQEGILSSDFSTPAQQALLAKLLFQKRQFRTALLSIADEVKKQSASDEEITQYYNENKNHLIQPEKVAVEYVSISLNDVEKNLQITNDQIETYYNTNKTQFGRSPEYHLAHIQVATDTDAQAIVQALKAGQDFSTLAKTKSQDQFTATKGGDLGWVKAGIFPDFDNQLTTLAVGETSQPIKVGNEYHIIKLLESKAQTEAPIAEVKDQIIAILRKELAAQNYANLTREMANKAFEDNSSLEGTAQLANTQVHQTSAFTRHNIPSELNYDNVINALFNSDLRQTNQNSEAIVLSSPTEQTFFVRISNYDAERPKTLEESKAEIETLIKQQKAEQTLLTQAKNGVEKLTKGDKNAVAFSAPQSLVYAQPQDPVFQKALFAMKKTNSTPLYGIARDEQQNVIIIALDNIEDGTTASMKALESQLSLADFISLRHTLLNNLRDHSDIKINQEFMDQLTGQ